MTNKLFRAGSLSCRTCGPLLVGYSERQLDFRRRAEVDAHLAGCDLCRAQLARMVAIESVLQSAQMVSAPCRTDLWQTLEAKVRSTPQRRAGWFFARARGTTGFWNPLLGDSGWGQALPIGATVLAAGVLVFVVVDSARHSPNSRSVSSLAAALPLDNKAIGGARPEDSKARIATASGTSTNLVEGPIVAANKSPQYVKHVQIAYRAANPYGPHRPSTRTRRSGSLQHVSSNFQIAAVENARRSTGIAHEYDGANSAAADRRHASSPLESESPRHNQIAVMTKKARADADRAVTLPAPVRFGAFEAAVALRNRRSSSVVASVSPSRGSYAAEDDSDTKVSFADASASIQRQQKLFSY